MFKEPMLDYRAVGGEWSIQGLIDGLDQWREASILEIIDYSEAYWSGSGEEITFRLTWIQVRSHIPLSDGGDGTAADTKTYKVSW